jgi:hypothetical protein
MPLTFPAVKSNLPGQPSPSAFLFKGFFIYQFHFLFFNPAFSLLFVNLSFMRPEPREIFDGLYRQHAVFLS